MNRSEEVIPVVHIKSAPTTEARFLHTKIIVYIGETIFLKVIFTLPYNMSFTLFWEKKPFFLQNDFSFSFCILLHLDQNEPPGGYVLNEPPGFILGTHLKR
jgi:hypothetical protein